MKKILYALSLGITLIMSIRTQASDKIAIVNVSSILYQLPQNDIITKQLEKEFKSRADDLQKQELDLQAKIQYLQNNSVTMEASERNRIEKEIIFKREAFNSRAQAFEKDSRRRQIEERNKQLNLIHNAVKKVAISDGYDVVIDANAVAYTSNAKDITAKVLKQVK